MTLQNCPSCVCKNSGREAGSRFNVVYVADSTLRLRDLDGYEERFLCPSPTQARTYRFRISRRVDADGQTAVLVHHLALEAARYFEASGASAQESVHMTGAQYLAPLEQEGGAEAAVLAQRIETLLNAERGTKQAVEQHVRQLNAALMAPSHAPTSSRFATGLYLRVDPWHETVTLSIHCLHRRSDRAIQPRRSALRRGGARASLSADVGDAP